MLQIGSQREQAPENPPIVCGSRTRSIRWGVRLCLACGERRALFLYRGVVKADRDHNLCFECYRAELNRLRARRLGAGSAGVGVANPRPGASKMVADRAGLMLDLQARRRRAQMMARHALSASDAVQVAEPLAS